MNIRSVLRSAALLATLAAAPLHAVPDFPALVNYQGYVTNNSGVAIPDSNYDITFRIYNSASAGNAVWAEKQTVTVNAGQFSVLLGNGSLVSGINHDPLATFITQSAVTGPLYLGLTVNAVNGTGAAEFTPRQQLLSNFFAHRALVADSASAVGAGGVSAASISTGAVTAAKLQDGAVNSAKIADLSVASIDIADGAVTFQKIGPLAVTTAAINTGAVSDTKLAAAAVTLGKIAPGAVDSSAIKDLSITASDLQDGAVTAIKLAASSINDTQLADGSVTNGKLASDAVTSAKLAAGSVVSGKLGSGAVSPVNTTFCNNTNNILSLYPPSYIGSSDPVLSVASSAIRAAAPLESSAYPFRVRQALSAGNLMNAGSYEAGFQIIKLTNGLTQANSPGLKLQLLNNNGGEMGGAFLNTAGTWTATSDARWKKGIHPAQGLLGSAMKLKPAWFRFKAQSEEAPESLGFIAQEVDKVLPNFVTRTEDRLTLDYAGLSTVAIGALQEQQALIEKQQGEIKALAEKNAALEERLSRIEKALSAVAAK